MDGVIDYAQIRAVLDVQRLIVGRLQDSLIDAGSEGSSGFAPEGFSRSRGLIFARLAD